MATYYSSPSNQREQAPILYSREHIPTSYQESSVLSSNMMVYMGSDSYSDPLASNSQQQSNCLNEMPGLPEDLVMSSGGGGVVHGQGLSLSLGTQIPSISFRSPNMMGGFAGSFLNPNSSRDDEHSRSAVGEYLSGFRDQGSSINMRAVPSSKYLKAAQQLLDEVVNVRKALKQQSEAEKSPNPKETGEEGSKSESTTVGGDSSASQQPPELSHTEKQDLQNKLTKLLSMLDEVDRRYKQYYHQMQIVVSSFDAIAGGGSAKPYTALALQTISRHFRCLRDAIAGQIKATRRGLGEDDGGGSGSNGGKGVGISRLRYVDQQLRQQRALQQLGMMQQHAWRPQRGLPESSVSILRAWLFEHFLHPYPKDSDKIMLARQTGLTRSQVSNWFINARVRLWKPMVEEMYKEETGEAEMDSNSSSENAAKATRADDEDIAEDLQQQQQQQQSTSSTGTGTGFVDPTTKPDREMAVGGGGPHYSGLMAMKPPSPPLPPRREDCGGGLYSDVGFHAEDGGERFMAAYHQMSEMGSGGRFGELGGPGSGSGVSLTLGLQHCDGPAPLHHQHQQQHHGFVSMRGHNDMYGGATVAAAPSVGPDGSDFEQPRFGLLHDFVV